MVDQFAMIRVTKLILFFGTKNSRTFEGHSRTKIQIFQGLHQLEKYH